MSTVLGANTSMRISTVHHYQHRAHTAYRPLPGRLTGNSIVALTTPTKARPRQKGNPLTIGFVTVLTETLRLLGVGRERYKAVAVGAPRNRPVRCGDVAGLMRRITADFKQAYFVTGVLDDSIYDPNCFFADPTVAFSGVDLWKRNLALLVPFLEQPSVELKGIRRLGRDEEGAEVVRAEWRLRTFLRLPWRPLIDLDGATEYTLNQESNQIVRHIESWAISGTQALLQMFRPANGDMERTSSGGWQPMRSSKATPEQQQLHVLPAAMETRLR